MNRTLRTPHAVASAVSATALALALAGCSGAAGPASLDGDYFADNRGSPGTVTIAGDSVTFEGFECPEGSPGESSWNAETSVGALDADRTEVTWTESGAWSGTTSFAVVGDGIDLGGYVFHDVESEAGAAEHARAMRACEDPS